MDWIAVEIERIAGERGEMEGEVAARIAGEVGETEGEVVAWKREEVCKEEEHQRGYKCYKGIFFVSFSLSTLSSLFLSSPSSFTPLFDSLLFLTVYFRSCLSMSYYISKTSL